MPSLYDQRVRVDMRFSHEVATCCSHGRQPMEPDPPRAVSPEGTIGTIAPSIHIAPERLVDRVGTSRVRQHVFWFSLKGWVNRLDVVNAATDIVKTTFGKSLALRKSQGFQMTVRMLQDPVSKPCSTVPVSHKAKPHRPNTWHVLKLAVVTAIVLLIGNADLFAQTNGSEKIQYAIAIHGGAGRAPTEKEAIAQREKTLRAATEKGIALLKAGGSSLDVVEAVIRMLEDESVFNAGKGAVMNAVGKHELDASIMDGRTRAAGAVGGVRTVKNPISLARLVICLLYTSPSPRDLSTSRMPSSA